MNKENLAMHRGLIKILDDGRFKLKAREMPVFLNVYKWAKELPNKLTEKEEPKELISEAPKKKITKTKKRVKKN